MTIEICCGGISDIIPALKDELQSDIKEKYNEQVIDIPGKYGKGIIKCNPLHPGFGLFVFNSRFSRDITLRCSLTGTNLLKFYFCLSGEVYFRTGNQETRINPYESLMVGSRQNIPQELGFFKNEDTQFLSLELDTHFLNEELKGELSDLPDRLQHVLIDAHHVFDHRIFNSIDIAETVKSLIDFHKEPGLIKKAWIGSESLRLFSLQLKQYHDDLNKKGSVTFRGEEINNIKDARRILLKDLKNPPDIKQLSREVGLNVNKLQEGFKKTYNSTVNQYLIHVRLEQAKSLLMEGSYSIQQVADRVGYRSKSRFAQRFKRKYGVLPSLYVKKMKESLDDSK